MLSQVVQLLGGACQESAVLHHFVGQLARYIMVSVHRVDRKTEELVWRVEAPRPTNSLQRTPLDCPPSRPVRRQAALQLSS